MTENLPKSEKSRRPTHFQPAGQATLIGSLPLDDHREALDWIFEATPHLPLWPQLPHNPNEGMMRQFIEGFPGILESPGTLLFDTSFAGFEEKMLLFFEAYLAVGENQADLDNSLFSMGKEQGAGIRAFIEYAAGKEGIQAVKGQITGPFTLLTGLTDAGKRLAYYDVMMREIVVKGLSARAAWQVRTLGKLHFPVIVFIDEPALAGLGSSSFIGVSAEEISQDLSEVIDGIQDSGGLAGIHVCANTDWNLLLSLDLDILSFDAYGFFDRLLTCRGQVLSFLKRGGILAWGIVPTGEIEHIEKETSASLAARWEENAVRLAAEDLSLPELLQRSLITPACGTGSMSPEIAKKVLQLTRDTSTILREKFIL